MIYFEVDHQGYAVDAAELAGVATSCPFVTYPGLPEKVLGIIQWSGKVYPAIDAFGQPDIDLRTSTILFSNEGIKGTFSEIAVPVPGSVRVFFAESTAPRPPSANPAVTALLIDTDGNEAYQLSLAKAAELVPKPVIMARTRGGRKIAA
jgi:hypothetical protein